MEPSLLLYLADLINEQHEFNRRWIGDLSQDVAIYSAMWVKFAVSVVLMVYSMIRKYAAVAGFFAGAFVGYWALPGFYFPLDCSCVSGSCLSCGVVSMCTETVDQK